MKRKEFIKKSVFAVVAGVPLVTMMQSCGDDDDADMDGDEGMANCLENGTSTNIGSNHGHTLSVSKEDVTAGAEKTYSILGDSGHNHDVTITAADFTNLQQNQAITVTSSSGAGHTHSVTVSCA